MIVDLVLQPGDRAAIDTYHDLALAAVDRLATEALGWIGPIEFHLAQSDRERLTAYRLRYEALSENGWMQPKELPDGLECDRYDDEAVHILACDGQATIATARLVFPRSGLRLPTEEEFDPTIETRGRVGAAGRFVVASGEKQQGQSVLAALLARGWLEVRARGYSAVCAAFASRAMLRVYQRMGLRLSTLGPPRRFWGEDRYPILFDVPSSSPRLLDRWRPGALH